MPEGWSQTSPWKPQAPRGRGLCTGTRHLPEICHGNGRFCIFCIHGSPPASRSRPKPTPPPPAKGVAWRTEMSAQDKFQISMYSGSFKHSVLKLKKKRQQQKLSTRGLLVLQSRPVAIQVRTPLSSWDLPSLSSWDSTALHPELDLLFPVPHRYLSQLNCCNKISRSDRSLFSLLTVQRQAGDLAL